MRIGALPLTISEADFQSTVIDYARRLGWRVSHQRPAQVRPGRWATATTGDVGMLDLVLARDGVVIIAELKRHNGRLTPAQKEWLEALGGHGRLWTPAQWGAIYEELRGARPDDKESSDD